jgi:hypothetical protein
MRSRLFLIGNVPQLLRGDKTLIFLSKCRVFTIPSQMFKVLSFWASCPGLRLARITMGKF